MKMKYQILLLFWSVAVLLPTLVNAFHYLIHHHDFQKHDVEGYWIDEAHDHHICPDVLCKIQPYFFDIKLDYAFFLIRFFKKTMSLYKRYFSFDVQMFFLRGPPK